MGIAGITHILLLCRRVFAPMLFRGGAEKSRPATARNTNLDLVYRMIANVTGVEKFVMHGASLIGICQLVTIVIHLPIVGQRLGMRAFITRTRSTANAIPARTSER